MREIASVLFVINSLLFNLFYNGQQWITDIWYISVYLCFALLFYEHRQKSNLLKLAFYLAILRAVYNVGILIGLYKYNLDEKGFGILTGIILVFIITEKWPKHHI
jgi:hypothetical protein